MKTSLQVLIVIMAFIALWSACQFDIINTVISIISLPLLILAYVFVDEIKDDSNA